MLHAIKDSDEAEHALVDSHESKLTMLERQVAPSIANESGQLAAMVWRRIGCVGGQPALCLQCGECLSIVVGELSD